MNQAISEIRLDTSARTEFIDITEKVVKLVPAGMKTGLCSVYCTHTTAGITINENADPTVVEDMTGRLDRMVPWDGGYSHREGNSAAHIKATLVGSSQSIPVQDGRLCLGTWQGIYFCEFDGPRTRRVKIVFLGSNT